MIEVLVERKKNGSLVKCVAEGHSGYAAKGFDIVCSAVSILIKTVLLTIEKMKGIELETETKSRGFVCFKIKKTDFDSSLEEKLVYAGDFLSCGLNSVKEEFPSNLKITYTTL